MNDFTILHISDLHANHKGTRLSRLMLNLLDDIRNEMSYVENKIIVVVTGDLVQKGNYDFGENVLSFFKCLREVLDTKFLDILIVPGNHDKLRNSLDSKILDSYSIEESESFYAQYWKYIQLNFDGYIELVDKIYEVMGVEAVKRTERKRMGTYGATVVEVEGKRLCFLLFNTAWSSEGDNDERNLRFGKFQLDEIKKRYDELSEEKGYDLVIALAHHPLSWLEGREESMLRSHILAQYFINCTVYISGHIHNRDVINWRSTRHSFTSLVSGLGWPEEEADMQHPYAHTYSCYTFNLDINSIDVYVRSSDDNDKFEPDFRIYSSQGDKRMSKIVMPIDWIKTQAYFYLGVVPGRSPKACYITEDIINLIQKYTAITGEFMRKMYIEIDKKKRDFATQIEASNDKALSEIEDYLYAGEKMSPNIKQKFEEKENIIYEEFSGYLQFICETLADLIEECINGEESQEKERRRVRVHFRYRNSRDGKYSQLCYNSNKGFQNYKMSDLEWGQLLQKSYEAKRALVASVNRGYCHMSFKNNSKKKDEKDKWTDFLTAVPQMEVNRCIVYDVEKRREKDSFPWITFGITTYDIRDSKALYILDYLKIDQIITDSIQQFHMIFPLNFERFLDRKIMESEKIADDTTK